MTGTKHDQSKLRYSLVPFDAMAAIVRVLEFGARKYAEGNWEKVPNGSRRYFDATLRHLIAWQEGEWLDAESGEPHLAHAGCCVLFCLALELRGRRLDGAS